MNALLSLITDRRGVFLVFYSTKITPASRSIINLQNGFKSS